MPLLTVGGARPFRGFCWRRAANIAQKPPPGKQQAKGEIGDYEGVKNFGLQPLDHLTSVSAAQKSAGAASIKSSSTR